MGYFAGLDVSLEETAICIVDDAGKVVREAGLRLGTPSRKDFPAHARELVADDPVLAGLVEALRAVIEVMTQPVERRTKRGLDEVKVEPTCRRLMGVPGVGALTALAFRATIDQPRTGANGAV